MKSAVCSIRSAHGMARMGLMALSLFVSMAAVAKGKLPKVGSDGLQLVLGAKVADS